MKNINKAAAILGSKGGSSKSERKVNASRENGKLGGRPVKASMAMLDNSIPEPSQELRQTVNELKAELAKLAE